MQIAIIENENIKQVGDYRALFPNTSFSSNGPSPEFMAENNCLGVTVFKPHDRETQKLQSCTPYIEADQVFTVEVVALSDDEIAANQEAAFAKAVKASIDAVQAHLDSAAQSKGYDNITSACSYAAAPNVFQAEGISFLTWRADVWSACHAMLADVQAGTRPMPTPGEIIADLPEIPT